MVRIWILNFDFKGFNVVFLCFFVSVFCSYLSGIRCRFMRVFEVYCVCRGSGNCVVLNVRD